MEPISPLYPPPANLPTNGGTIDQSSAGANQYSANPGRSGQPAIDTSPVPLPPHRFYSPSKEEIETHPIRERLSLFGDQIYSEFGSALPREETEQQEQTATRAVQEDDDLRQEDAEARIDDMTDNNNIEKGDEVSYQWGGGRPGGTVTDKATEGAVTMETKKGNEVKKGGDSDNPALYISRDEGHDVVKKASEVDVEEKGSGNKGGDEKKDEGADEKKEENGDAKTGEKRSADEPAEEKKDKTAGAKKQKTSAEPKQNGDAPKKKGRPAKANGSAAKKETKKKEPKKAATETGEPRRSGRNKA